MDVDLKEWFAGHDDLASTAEVAVLLDIAEGDAREFGRRSNLRRIGSSFAFRFEDAKALAAELEEDEEEDEQEDEGDED